MLAGMGYSAAHEADCVHHAQSTKEKGREEDSAMAFVRRMAGAAALVGAHLHALMRQCQPDQQPAGRSQSGESFVSSLCVGDEGVPRCYESTSGVLHRCIDQCCHSHTQSSLRHVSTLDRRSMRRRTVLRLGRV